MMRYEGLDIRWRAGKRRWMEERSSGEVGGFGVEGLLATRVKWHGFFVDWVRRLVGRMVGVLRIWLKSEKPRSLTSRYLENQGSTDQQMDKI